MGAIKGISNPSNNCYINAIIQTLLRIPDMQENMSSSEGPWKKVVELYHHRTRNPVTDNPGLQALMTAWFPQPEDQQCAHECLVHVLDSLPVVCVSSTRILLHQFTQTHPAAPTRRRRHFEHCLLLSYTCRTLEDGYHEFMQMTSPDPANLNLRTSFKLVQAPPVMFLAVQRDAWMGTRSRLVRSTRTFQYPYRLDGLEGRGARYVLSGLITHTGSACRGHYIAVLKHNNSWVKIDDQTVTPSSMQEAMNQKREVYIMMYIRQES